MSTSVRRQYVWDSQGNKILVGDIRECWEKIERIKLEKKVEEERADQLEADKEQLSRERRWRRTAPAPSPQAGLAPWSPVSGGQHPRAGGLGPATTCR